MAAYSVCDFDAVRRETVNRRSVLELLYIDPLVPLNIECDAELAEATCVL